MESSTQQFFLLQPIHILLNFRTSPFSGCGVGLNLLEMLPRCYAYLVQRFGEELNAEKVKKAIRLRPESVAQLEFLEWTEADRLRRSKFVGLGEDENPRSVAKEQRASLE